MAIAKIERTRKLLGLTMCCCLTVGPKSSTMWLMKPDIGPWYGTREPQHIRRQAEEEEVVAVVEEEVEEEDQPTRATDIKASSNFPRRFFLSTTT